MGVVFLVTLGRVQLKPDGTRLTHGRGSGEETGEWSGQPVLSHYLGTWCIQHY